VPRSRLDLPRLVDAIQELSRAIDTPPPPNGKPPAWLVEQYERTTLGAEGTPQNLTQADLIDKAKDEVLYWLAPIAESALSQRQKDKLAELQERLGNYFALGQGLTSNRGQVGQLLELLESVVEQLNVAPNGKPRPSHPTAEYCLLPGYQVQWDLERGPVKLRPLLWQILNYLLHQSNYPVEVSLVEDAIWSGRTTKKSLSNRLSELYQALEPIKFPWTWRVSNGHVHREG
jgi:hypothetical protein